MPRARGCPNVQTSDKVLGAVGFREKTPSMIARQTGLSKRTVRRVAEALAAKQCMGLPILHVEWKAGRTFYKSGRGMWFYLRRPAERTADRLSMGVRRIFRGRRKRLESEIERHGSSLTLEAVNRIVDEAFAGIEHEFADIVPAALLEAANRGCETAEAVMHYGMLFSEPEISKRERIEAVYDKPFKQVVAELEARGCSRSKIMRLFGIKSKDSFYTWIDRS